MAESTSTAEKKSVENSSVSSAKADFLNSDESTGLLASGITDQPSVSTLPKFDQQRSSSSSTQPPPPVVPSISQSTKPILTRQDPIINLVSPQLSITTLGRSNEDATSEDSQSGLRTKLARDSQSQNESETPIISLSFEKYDEPVLSTGATTTNYFNKDPPYMNKNVCRMCRTNEKDAFNTTTKLIKKTNSKDNVSNPGRFTLYLTKHYSSYSPSSAALHTSSPLMGSRVIRQSSQPEESSANYCVSNCPHVFVTPNHSLRQSKDGNEGIAEIAADSLRVNGVMKPFRQVSTNNYML